MAEKVLNGRTGFHFTPNNPQSLAALMQDCVSPREKLELKIPTPATAEEMASHYLQLIN
jgi:ribosomal protein L10